jgi:hypothetical protein
VKRLLHEIRQRACILRDKGDRLMEGLPEDGGPTLAKEVVPNDTRDLRKKLPTVFFATLTC